MKYINFLCILFTIMNFCGSSARAQNNETPVKIGIAGLSHGHARLVFKFLSSSEVEIVGIAESNPALVKRFREDFNLPEDLFYKSLPDLIKERKLEAVATFTSTKDHLNVVEICAPKGIHVMVEKPLAVSLQDAIRMKELAETNDIILYTNYETTWHRSMEECERMVFQEKRIGDLYKLVFHDGNSGVKRNRIQGEFFQWLTDPVQNGGGAIMDFGCYGINIITWLTKGQMPESVYAHTRQFKPELYPNVDDDALIVLNYANFQCIVQASWNWEIPRKDAEFYGNKGYVIAENSSEIRYCLKKGSPEQQISFSKQGYPINEPFEYFADLVRGKRKMNSYECGSLENNMVVTKILDAAKKSAKKGLPVEFQM